MQRNFYEFIVQTRSDVSDLREHVVSMLKTMDSNEERVFKAADFGLPTEEKEFREKANQNRLLKEEIDRIKLTKELERLKSMKENEKSQG